MPDDQPHDVVLAGVAGVDRTGDPPVAEHRDAIGDGAHLVDVVRDEDDARPFRDDAADEREQRLDVGRRQERRRLVEDEERRRRGLLRRSWSKARTIARSARSTEDSRPTGAVGIDREAVSGRRDRARRAASRRQSIRQRSSTARSPISRFSSTVSEGTSARCWCTKLMPSDAERARPEWARRSRCR